MSTMWAQRREDLLSDCNVSPHVFNQMVARLAEFVVPYHQALETKAGQHPIHLYLQGLLSHLQRKNAEEIATLVDVERQVIQDGSVANLPPGVMKGQVSVSGGRLRRPGSRTVRPQCGPRLPSQPPSVSF